MNSSLEKEIGKFKEQLQNEMLTQDEFEAIKEKILEKHKA